MSRLTKALLFASPEECEQAFYDALEAADVDAVADAWLDDDDVCCVHPGGARLVGYAAVRSSLAALLSDGPVQIRTVTKTRDQSRSAALNVPTQLLRYFVIPAASRFSTNPFPAVAPLFHLALTSVRSNLAV